LVIAAVGHNNQETIADNNGATPFTLAYEAWDSGSPFGATLTIFSRIIQSGDPASYSFTADSANRMTVACVTFSDPNTSSPFDVSPAVGTLTTDSTDDGVVPTVDITTLSDKAIHLLVVMQDSANSPSYGAVAGYTQLGIGTAGAGEAMDVYYKTITTAGATGAKSIPVSIFVGAFSQSFAVKNNAGSGATCRGALSLLQVGGC
jgi:hypothetical protein